SAGRILAAFGDRPIAEVKTREVSMFLRALDAEGLTPRNVNKHRQMLAAMFQYACREDAHDLPANPAAGADKRPAPPPAGRDDYVFCNVWGRRLDGSALRRRYRRACTAAGLRPVKLHGLRHAAGSIVARTADPVFVRDMLGHAKLTTTDRYVTAKYRPEEYAR